MTFYVFSSTGLFLYIETTSSSSPSPLHQHKLHVRQVLQRLLENQFYVKAEKCEFHVSTITFLGFILGDGQVSADPAKIKIIKDWPIPESRKQLQCFLGFANFYRRFINKYSKFAKPLNVYLVKESLPLDHRLFMPSSALKKPSSKLPSSLSLTQNNNSSLK